MCAERSDEHTRGIAPQSHKIVMLGAHCFPRPLLLTLTRMANVKSKPPKASKPVNMRCTRRGKREKPGGEKPPPAKRPRPNFKVGDCVNLHDSKLGKCHLPCVVQVFGDRCLLCCHKGVLTTGYAKGQLTAISSDLSISVDNWRTAGRSHYEM